MLHDAACKLVGRGYANRLDRVDASNLGEFRKRFLHQGGQAPVLIQDIPGHVFGGVAFPAGTDENGQSPSLHLAAPISTSFRPGFTSGLLLAARHRPAKALWVRALVLLQCYADLPEGPGDFNGNGASQNCG